MRRRNRARWASFLVSVGLLISCLGCQPQGQIRMVNLQVLVREHPAFPQLEAIESRIAQLTRARPSPFVQMAPPGGGQVGPVSGLGPQVSWFHRQWSHLTQDRLHCLDRELARKTEEQTGQYQEQLVSLQRSALAKERGRQAEHRRGRERATVEEYQSRILNLQLAVSLFDFNRAGSEAAVTPHEVEAYQQRRQKLAELRSQQASRLVQIKQDSARNLEAFRQGQEAERPRKVAEYRTRLEADTARQRQATTHRLTDQVQDRTQWLEQAFFPHPGQTAALAKVRPPVVSVIEPPSPQATRLRSLAAQLRSSLEDETQAIASWLAAQKGMRLQFAAHPPARRDATAQVRNWLRVYWKGEQK